jgi:hypothetical protein
LQNGISLKDQERLGEYKKWLYYYFIVAQQEKEAKEAQDMADKNLPRGGDYTGRTQRMEFPSDFVSELRTLQEVGIKEE